MFQRVRCYGLSTPLYILLGMDNEPTIACDKDFKRPVKEENTINWTWGQMLEYFKNRNKCKIEGSHPLPSSPSIFSHPDFEKSTQ